MTDTQLWLYFFEETSFNCVHPKKPISLPNYFTAGGHYERSPRDKRMIPTGHKEWSLGDTKNDPKATKRIIPRGQKEWSQVATKNHPWLSKSNHMWEPFLPKLTQTAYVPMQVAININSGATTQNKTRVKLRDWSWSRQEWSYQSVDRNRWQ